MSGILLITANVGSLFDENVIIRTQWKEEIIQAIRRQKPKFIAIHFQETGGKAFRKYSREVPDFVSDLADLLLPAKYSTLRAFLDLNFDRIEEYTALGTIIFVHSDWVSKVEQYNFQNDLFVPIDPAQPRVIHDNIAESSFARKEKFAKEFWPAIRWGRKGYLHTRFRVCQRILDLVNIHLFHDESNLEITENPLLYSQNRKRALNYTIDMYSNWMRNSTRRAPGNLFIFGDFNFRLRADGFLEKITKDQQVLKIEESNKCPSESNMSNRCPVLNNLPHHEPLKRNLSAIEFRPKEDKNCDDDNNIVLRIEKKLFDYYDGDVFVKKWQQYRDDDKEPQEFNLNELLIHFPPTYPWSEDPSSAHFFMKTRAPAWCDRVLMNENAFTLVRQDPKALYNCIGLEACMGDHKPVMLSFALSS